jgi:tetratricopeptide (TPR) repeat protein
MLPLGIVFITGCIFSYLRWNESLSESKLFYLGGLGVSFVEIAWAVSITPDGATLIFTVLPLVVCMFSWVFFYHGLMIFVIFGVVKEIMGDGRLGEHISFDKAEAAVKKRNYAQAEELFIEAVQRFQTRAEPRIKLAEFYADRGRHEDAAAQIETALNFVKDMEARARFTFRLAEMLQKSGKMEEARAALKTFQESAANTKYAEFAALRLAEM